MKRIIFVIFALSFCTTVYAQRVDIQKKSPMSGWEFNEWSVMLNGRTFGKYDVAKSFNEQSGFAIVQGRSLFYWLYNTIAYHNGNADTIYNRYLPYWVEALGYVIDYDNISVTNNNTNLATSVKALMQQRGADVSVTIITGPIGDTPKYDIDYLIINEHFVSKGTYKTTVYPLIKFYPGF